MLAHGRSLCGDFQTQAHTDRPCVDLQGLRAISAIDGTHRIYSGEAGAVHTQDQAVEGRNQLIGWTYDQTGARSKSRRAHGGHHELELRVQ